MTRQRTLLEFVANDNPRPSVSTPKLSRRTYTKSPAKSNHRSPFKRALTESQSEQSQSDDDDDVRGVKLAPATQAASISSYDDREDAEDDVLPSPAVRKRLRRNQKRAPSTPPSSDKGSLSPQSEEDDDLGPTQTRRSRKKRVVIESDEDSDQIPKRRRLVKGKGKPSEDEAGEEDLLAEVDKDRIIENRFRSSKKSAYSRRLEELKRRKRGEPKVHTVEDSDDGSEEDADEELGFAPFQGARRDTLENDGIIVIDDDDDDDNATPQDKEAEDDEDGFIVEDDEGAQEYELPEQFSSNSHQDLNIHFKVVCQLFVHLATIPPEGRKEYMKASARDSYFSLPLRTLRRKLSGIRDSLVTSSAWKPEFVQALKVHPEFNVTDLDYAIPGCDACHMGGRKSMFVGRVAGDDYDPDSYEPKEITLSDDESEGDEDNKKEFNLGRFCAARAEAFHNFTHWEYKLFTALKDEVEALQNPDRIYRKGKAFIRISWGGGIERPKNVDDADEIMEWLDRRNIIQAEWSAVQKLMEGAHGLDFQRAKVDE